MGPCPDRSAGGAPLSSIIVPDEVEDGPAVDELGEVDLAEDAADGNAPAVPPNPPAVGANLPDGPAIIEPAIVLQRQPRNCRAANYTVVCGLISTVFCVTVYGVLGPRATPSTLLMRPWRLWMTRKHDHGVPRIMMWTGRPSESTAAPPFFNAPSVLAVPKSPNYNENWIACPFIDNTDDDDPLGLMCTVTYDRSLLMESDAIVFTADSVNVHDLPLERAILQLWVLWARTAPALDASGAVRFNLFGAWKSRSSISHELLSLFNWTMGSREGAHINSTNKYFRPSSPSVGHRLSNVASRGPLPLGGLNPSERSAMLKRRGDSAWIAADCEQRMFEEEGRAWRASEEQANASVAKSLKMHVMPNCGVGYCESMVDCVAYVARHFNFIVVTEKPACFPSVYELAYEAFKHDLVPVVLMSSPKVQLHLPPNSTVSIAEMLEPMYLEEYLRYLLDHPTAYEAYFAWKHKFTVATLVNDLCPLCAALHGFYKRKFPAGRDVREWWHLRAMCGDGRLFA